MGDEPKTVEEVIKLHIYNDYLFEMMRRLELRGVTLHQLHDFRWIVYGNHYDELPSKVLKAIEDFTPPTREDSNND